MIYILLHACNDVLHYNDTRDIYFFSGFYKFVYQCFDMYRYRRVFVVNAAFNSDVFLYAPYKEPFTQKSEIISFRLNTSVRRTTCIISLKELEMNKNF